MRKKQPVLFAQKFPNADPLALRLLERLLAFDPKDRPTAEEVLFALLFYKNRKTYLDDMTSTFALFLFSFFFFLCLLCEDLQMRILLSFIKFLFVEIGDPFDYTVPIPYRRITLSLGKL